ncbi:hypothetical protein O4H49_01950 [Kiloniella laminariae]|uniref:Uncharacterized protein n=1 Tax=Kiloniella laminariae TaxID=454162 RepID=A0ABT4LEJ0_9PROT|nr:hypothetical protein [Kiloniella laminariae]MCZ4279521.1 hypothetical protein [Kiloniella laminariae]
MSRSTKWSIFFGLCALILGGYAILFLPSEREVKSLGIFLFKLTPFSLAALAIALFDPDLFRRFRLTVPLSYLCFAVFFFFYVPKMFFDVAFREAENLYYMTLLIVPCLILAFALIHRMGGGSTGMVLRIAFGMLVLMLSGIEDLAFLTINPHEVGSKYNPIPEVWGWASHMKVRLGHFPSKYEAFAFIGVHVVLALVIAFYHFRWLHPLGRYFGVQELQGGNSDSGVAGSKSSGEVSAAS